jgi:hypothetical protein
VWKVNFLTPTDEYITYRQVFGADQAELRRILEDRVPAGELTLGAGQTWTTFALNSDDEGAEPVDYALATFALGDAFILTGSGTVDEFAELAGALSASMAEVAP